MAMIPKVSVMDIPNLDAPAYYTTVGQYEGYPTIRLPSGHEAVHLTSPEDVQRAFTDPTMSRAMANVPGGPSFYPIVLPSTLLLTLDPPQHGAIKKLVSAKFTANAVAALHPEIVATVRELVEDMATGRTPADLLGSVVQPLASRMICRLLGVPDQDGALFEEHAVGLQTMGWDGTDPAASVDALVGYLIDLVNGRRTCAPDGLVGHVLANAEDVAEPLIVGLLLLIVVAADQSVVSIMTKGLYALLAAPPLFRVAVEEPGLRAGFVEEFARLLPLGYIPALPRVATVDTSFSLGVIRAGQTVFPDGLRAGRDPALFPEPEVINPKRGSRHFGFGHGVHHCLGAALARAEMVETLNILAERLPTLALGCAPDELTWHDGWLVRRPTRVPVIW